MIALSLVNMSGRALATIRPKTQTLVFSDADIANHTVQTVPSGDLTQSVTGACCKT